MTQPIPELFKRLTSGVYVIGVADGETRNAFTAAWVMQVSYDPLLIALSINKQHASYALLKAGGRFSVNVLKKTQADLAAHFGQPASADKLAGQDWSGGSGGVPLLNDALAWFECEVTHECPAGDHVLAVGKVISGRLLDANAQPLSYGETGDTDGAASLYPERFER
ncbi:flavin reductase family protein [Methyloligella sp. 2.7D]|uniref:flavin reductase family protein n=1 Tax=unclassified Methyloligella TaxID=2625955 RepID=UPI00157BDF36|nr:flavin reductase family protein [Methyloligella sp. GL2]QKP76859.1 flavin reductase [Methyloligella sp. GL2]